MKVQELVEVVKDNAYVDVKDLLEINKYISIEKKREIARHVLAVCIVEEYDFIMIDEFLRDVYFDMYMLTEYTNLELSHDVESMCKEFDLLYSLGLMDNIVAVFADDYTRARNILNAQIKYILADSSIESQLAKAMTRFDKQFISVLNVISEKIGEFDINSILPKDTDINELIEKIKKLN